MQKLQVFSNVNSMTTVANVTTRVTTDNYTPG